jgi:hypothetical protein
MDRGGIEQRLEQVLSNANGWLPEHELEDMRSLIKAGEPGIALANFCTQLEEYDIAVPPAVAVELQNLASAIGMAVSRWIEKAAHA